MGGRAETRTRTRAMLVLWHIHVCKLFAKQDCGIDAWVVQVHASEEGVHNVIITHYSQVPPTMAQLLGQDGEWDKVLRRALR